MEAISEELLVKLMEHNEFCNLLNSELSKGNTIEESIMVAYLKFMED